MLKIINSYYYYIYNNINNNIKRVMTMFKIKILALDFVLVMCYNTNFNNKIGGIYANS